MEQYAWRKLYPFQGHWRQLTAGRYHFVDEGPRGSASEVKPLLMVHGNPTWSFYWRRLINEFSTTYRVIAPDHLGCGLSDKPQDYSYRLQDHIDNLVGLIDDLNLSEITMLGHDWGGAIGLGAALARPARFGRFVLFNTGAFPPPFFPWRIRVCRTPWLGRYALQGWNLFSRAALRMAVQDPSTLTPEVRQGLLAPYNSWEHRIAVYRFVQDIPQSPSHPTWKTLEGIEAGLSSLSDRPCQMIWGMRDWCFRPECLERFLQHFPQARVKRLPNAGHWVVEEAHAEIVECLHDFFATTEPVALPH